MAKRRQSLASKRPTDARDQDRQKGGQVGRDIPDESKERHTEIAVEAGRKLQHEHEEKH